jgi:hypothetical protein
MGTLVAFPVKAQEVPQSVYVDTKDTAKLIRAKVKTVFPNIKFSVKISRYSGGSSIDINWTDGPTTKQVDAVLEEYRGDYFDGMIDYHGGIIRLVDGKHVHYGGSMSTNRSLSRKFCEQVLVQVQKKYGESPKVVGTYSFHLDSMDNGERHRANEMLNNTMADADGNILAYIKNVKSGESNIVREY